MIVTFYSYKGGVGRSMALANVAEWYRRQGLRVVMVDWDLEAPGLETFFAASDAQREAIRGRLGLVDLLQTYRELFPGLALPSAGAGEGPATPAERLARYVALLQDALPPLSHLLVPLRAADDSSLPPLWLLPAGNRSAGRFDSYAETVQQFDWSAFYARFEGEAYFEWMRRQLLAPDLADVVLIDSRTGVTEMSGVCTRQLADVVVMMCAPNDQNLDGVAKMARSFVRPELNAARQGEPIRLVMVPSRIDVSEGHPVDLFESKFHALLDGFMPSAFRAARTDFASLRIPYISAYAFDESLAVGDPQGVKALQGAYANLGVHLALLAPAASALRAQCAAALRDKFGLPAVVVLALEPSLHDAAEALRRGLSGGDLIVLPLPAGGDAALERIGSFSDAQRQGLSALVVAESETDAKLRPLRRRLRELGIEMHVMAAGHTLSAPEREALLQRLLLPAVPARVPLLAPPPGRPVVGRERALAELRGALLQTGAMARTVALWGPAGMGKTALARTLAGDEAVLDHFDGGVLWLTLGPQPDLVAGLGKILAAFEGSTAPIPDLDELQRRLATHLYARRCLIVVEDAESAAALEGVPRGGAGCVTLVTTRSRDLAAGVGESWFYLGGLDDAGSVAVLLEGVAAMQGSGGLDVPARDLAQALGGAPLALLAANRVLRSQVRRSGDVAAALSDLQRRVQREGLLAIDTPHSEGSVFAAMMAATEQLTAADRQRLPLLASLPPAGDFDLGTAAGLLDLPPADAAGMLQRLADIGWLMPGGGDTPYHVDALVLAVLRSLAFREQQAQYTRIVRPPSPGLRVFLCYSRRDAVHARNLYERLAIEFGRDAVFFDLETIEPGANWVDATRKALESASVAVAVIGPEWHRVVRTEVADELALALERHLPLIPVLVGGAELPPASVLPERLRGLAERQALSLGETSFQRDIDTLVAALLRMGTSPHLAAPVGPVRGSPASAPPAPVRADTEGGTVVGKLFDSVRKLVGLR